MELEVSELITLRTLKLSNAKELLEAVEISRENLLQYMPWTKNLTDLASAEGYINSRINSNEHGSEWFAIYFTNQFSGVFGIKHINPVTNVSELGYWLSSLVRGNRIVNQVFDVILPYMHSETLAESVEFHCLESNSISVKVVKRVGASLVTYIDNTMDIPNKEQRLGIYRLELKDITRR